MANMAPPGHLGHFSLGHAAIPKMQLFQTNLKTNQLIASHISQIHLSQHNHLGLLLCRFTCSAFP